MVELDLVGADELTERAERLAHEDAHDHDHDGHDHHH